MIEESFQRELARSAIRGERTSPDAFIGRKGELDRLRSVVDDAEQGNVPLHTRFRLVFGVPGAGKTALCSEFIRRVNVRGGKTLALILPAESLNQPPLSLTHAIANKVQDAGRRWLGGSDKQRGFARFVGDAIRIGQRFVRTEGMCALREQSHGLGRLSSLDECLHFMANHVLRKDQSIALCIDEIQGLEGCSDLARDNLRVLYNGEHPARLSLHCFGLSNSHRVLQSLGISRISATAKIHLQGLKPGEGKRLLEENLDAAGLTERNAAWSAHLSDLGMANAQWQAWRKELILRLDEASDDFPQHLAAGLQAACQTALDSSDQSRALGESDIQKALKRHEEHRKEYYEGRLSDEKVARHRMALGGICEVLSRRRKAGVPARIRSMDALNMLATANDFDAPICKEQAMESLQAAIDKGILEESLQGGRHMLPPPIPSMERHMRGIFSAMRDAHPSLAERLGKEMERIASLEETKREPPPRP